MQQSNQAECKNVCKEESRKSSKLIARTLEAIYMEANLAKKVRKLRMSVTKAARKQINKMQKRKQVGKKQC